jgi:hypothetical protein
MTTQSTGLSTGIEKYIDDTIASLLSARDRLAQRGTPAKLREIEITLASLAMALDLEMEGEIGEAKRALRKADWRFGFQHADDDEVFEPTCG